MKKNHLKSFCARCLTLLVLALMSTNLAWGETKTITEEFSSNKASTNNYDCGSAITTADNQKDWNYAWTPGGSGTVFKNGIKLGAKSATGSVSNSTMLKDIPAGTSITIKVYAAVWNTDGGKVKFTYNGNSETKDAANTAITSTSSTYNASDFASATEFSITKAEGVNEIKIESSQKRILIDKVEVVYVSVPAKTLQSIAVKTAPTTTSYNVGDKFNPAGLVITATYDTGDEDIAYAGNESDFTFSPDLTTALTTANTSVTITYGGKTTTQAITVNKIQLATPTNLNATPASTSATLTWDAVANATSYEVNINNKTLIAETNSLLVGELTASTAYTWSVKAKGDNTTYSDSELSAESNFTTLAPPSVAYTVNFNGNNHGTPASASITEASAGAGVTLPGCTPSDGYQFVGWATTETATEADAGKAGETYYPTANITLYAVYNEVYTINYMVNGVNTDAQENVVKGTALVFPTVNDFGGKVFVDWSETEIAEATDVKPTLVETAGLTATANATYYAVFVEKSEGTPTKVSASATFNGTSTGGNSCTEGYSLTLTKTTNKGGYIQDNASANEQTIIKMQSTTAMFSSTPSKVTVKAKLGGGTAKDDLTEASQVYAALVDNNGDIIEGTQTILTKKITTTTGSDFSVDIPINNIGSAYGVAIYHTKLANYNVRYFSLEVNCEKSNITYSNYCTTVASRTQDVEITTAKYATLGLPYAVTIPDGVSAYTAIVEGTSVKMTKINDGVIPADCGVILYAEAGDYTFTETTDVDAITGNQLVAVVSGPYTCTGEDVGKVYYLGKDGDKAVFKKLNENGTIAAGKAYLKLDAALDAGAKLDVTFGEPTGIESLTPALSEGKGVYNLNGMKVNEAYKGIVIMNGKKYINK